MSRGKIILSVVAASAFAGGLLVAFAIPYFSSERTGQSPNENNEAEFGNINHNRYYCAPVELSNIDIDFPIRQPDVKSMPSGYELQVVAKSPNRVSLFYDDQSFCPQTTSDIRQFTDNKAITVAISPQGEIMNATRLNEADLEGWQSDKLVGDRVQALEINGHSGHGWDLIDAVDENGEPVSLPGGWRIGTLFFYHEQDNTMYGLYADESLDKLVEIARTIS